MKVQELFPIGSVVKWYQTTYDFRYQTDEFRDQRGI